MSPSPSSRRTRALVLGVAQAVLLASCTLEFDARLLDRLGPRCPATPTAPLGLERVALGTVPSSVGAALEDLDGDSDLDLFACDGPIVPATTRSFETRVTDCGPPELVDVTSAWLGDRTAGSAEGTAAFVLAPLADEHFDLLAPSDNGGRALRGQAGTPLWTTTETFFVPGGDGELRGGGVAVGDLDGDGRLDVVLAGTSAPDQVGRLLVTNGGTRLTELPAADVLTGTERVWIVDIDDDGVSEVLAAPPDGPARLLRLEGQSLVDDEGLTNPELLSLVAVLALGDLDDDGDLDVFTLRDGVTTPLHATVLENVDGTLVAHTGADLGGVGDDDAWNFGNAGATIAIADLDLDGRLDVLLNESRVQFLRNATTRSGGSAAFAFEHLDTRDLGAADDLGGTWRIAVGDLEGDGDVDVAPSSLTQAFLLRNTVGGVPWLRVRLRGPEGNPRGVGARVCAFVPGMLPASGCRGEGLVGMRVIQSSSMQLEALEASMATPGLSRVDLRVVWPSGLGTTDLRDARTSRGLVVEAPR